MAYPYIKKYGRTYNYYDTYSSWDKCLKAIKHLRKKNPKLHYYVIKAEQGYVNPRLVYDLYTDKFKRLSFF